MSATSDKPLLSLCCGAHPTPGTGGLRRHTSGLWSGFCGVCGERSPFAPGGLTGGQPRMVVPPLQVRDNANTVSVEDRLLLARIECRRGERAILLLALVALSGWLLFVGVLTMRALEGRQGAPQGGAQEGVGGIGGMGGVHAPQGSSHAEGRQP